MIKFNQLLYGFNKDKPVGLVNGSCKASNMLALIGANGSGKSTLLQTIAGVLAPLGGSLEFTNSKPKISYISQYTPFDRQFPLTVSDLMLMGYLTQIGAFKGVNSQRRHMVEQVLARVDLADCLHKNICELSGGQMQRVLFSRLLLEQSQIILLDEPFAGVDIYSIHLLLEILTDLKNQGCTIITAVHDWDLAKTHFDQVLWLKDEQAIWGQPNDLFEQDDCCVQAEHPKIVSAGEMV